MSSLFPGVTKKAPQRVAGKKCVLRDVTRLAWVEQHRPRREADGIGHQNDELLRHVPAHVAHRQPEAEPEEPGEHCIDLRQVVSEPNLRWEQRLFEFLTTLTFRALHRHKHVPDSSNHSLDLIKLFSSSSPEGHCGGNQPPDVSMCLSPPKPKYNERFTRQTLSMMFG